jgi:hypothetical protein
MVEAFATKLGLDLALDMGCHAVEAELDCTEVANYCPGGTICGMKLLLSMLIVSQFLKSLRRLS